MKIYAINNINQTSYKGILGKRFLDTYMGTVEKPKNLEQSNIYIRNYIKDIFYIRTNNADDILEALICRIKELYSKNKEYADQIKELEEDKGELMRIIDKLGNFG